MPSWVKDPAAFSLLINVRGEMVCEKPAYRPAMKHRRCLIPADGFYEWQPSGRGKQPFYIRMTSGAPLAFAGLWETWTGPNGGEVDTAAIVTTRANAALSAVHDRMPVIVPPQGFDLWLDCNNVDARAAEALIVPAPDDQFEFWPVSTQVNRIANDHAALLQPADIGREKAEEPVQASATIRAKKADEAQGSLF